MISYINLSVNIHVFLANLSKIEGLNGLGSLTDLYLSNNQISKIQGLDSLNLNQLNVDGNNLPLSELAVAMQHAKNYYLGDQINVFFTKQVLTPGQTLDLSSEAVILEQNTTFTVYDKNGKQTTDVKVDNGKLTFAKAGSYTVKMTNPYVLSQGDVHVWNEEEQTWDLTSVHSWLASATSWQRVFQSNYQSVYGFYNINNANLAGALDQGMANGFRPSGNLDALLIEADFLSPGAGAVVFN